MAPRKFIQGRRYTLTIWDMTFSEARMIKDEILYFIGCEEVAPETGRSHYQSYIELSKKCNKAVDLCVILGLKSCSDFNCEYSNGTPEENQNYVTKILTKPVGFDKIEIGQIGQIKVYNKSGDKSTLDELMTAYIQSVKSGMKYNDLIVKHSKFFCSKLMCFKEIYNNFRPKRVIPIAQIKLRPVQEEVISNLDVIDDREITIMCGPSGNDGKSTFAHYIHNLDDRVVQIIESGKKEDISCAIKEDASVVIFDLPRSATDESKYISYGSIEAIKNGVIFSGKYNSQSKILDIKPKVIVMTNNLDPELYKKLTIGRIKLYHLKGNDEYDVYKNMTIEQYKRVYGLVHPVECLFEGENILDI